MAGSVTQRVAWGLVMRFGVKRAGKMVAEEFVAHEESIRTDNLAVYERVA